VRIKEALNIAEQMTADHLSSCLVRPHSVHVPILNCLVLETQRVHGFLAVFVLLYVVSIFSCSSGLL